MTDLLGPAWLFCPADRPDRYPKALAAADVVILDLEDAVAPARKDEARAALRELTGTLDLARTVVRVNAADTGAVHEADRLLVAELGLPRVMLAKAERPEDAVSLAALGCEVIALVETARGVLATEALAAADGVTGLMWGADDLAASMGGTASRRAEGGYRDVARYARVRALTAAKAHDRWALDAVHMDIADLAGLAAECEDAVAIGFDATVAIHPSQIATIREAYRPTPERVAWARGVLVAAGSGGVTTFEGRMVDGPIYAQAQRVLRLATNRGGDR